MWSSRLAAAAAGFLTQILLARALGLAEYGAFAAALALVSFLLPLAGFGVPAYWLRAFGKGLAEGRRSVRSGFTILLISSVAICGVAILLALILKMPLPSRVPALVLAALVPSQAILSAAGAVFQLQASFVALAWCVAFPYMLRLVVAGGALAWGAAPIWVAAGYAATALALGAAYLPSALRIRKVDCSTQGMVAVQSSPPRPDTSWTPAQMAGRVWPFALSGFFYAAYFQGSVTLLSLVSGQEAAGVYSASLSVLSLGYLLPAVVFQQVLLPYLNRWLEHDRDRLIRTFDASIDVMSAASLGFAGIVAGLGPNLLPKLFGAGFASAGPLLVALALCFPVRFLSSVAEAALLTEDDMRRRVWCQGFAALFGVSLLLLFAPHYGVWGALAAILGSELCVLASYAFVVHRYAMGGGILLIRFRWRTLLAILLVALVVAANLIAGQHLAVGVGSAALAMGVSVALLLTSPAMGRLR